MPPIPGLLLQHCLTKASRLACSSAASPILGHALTEQLTRCSAGVHQCRTISSHVRPCLSSHQWREEERVGSSSKDAIDQRQMWGARTRMFGTNGPQQQEGQSHPSSKEQQQKQHLQQQQQQQQEQQLQQQLQKLLVNKGRKKPIDKLKQRLKEMQEKQEKPAITYAVAKAHYLGKELNMRHVQDSFKHALLHVAPDYLLLCYAKDPDPSASQGSAPQDQLASSLQGDPEETGADDVNRLVPLEGSMAVFSSGSVVFYGSRLGSEERDKDIEQQGKWLGALEKHVSRDTILDTLSYSPAADAATMDKRHKTGTEEVKLQVGGSMKKIFTKGPDLVVLQQWDLGTTEILSRVMAQSVAIDVYTRVCGILGLAPPAWQPDIDQRELAALLTDASTLEIRLMSKLGLMDKSHTPWESDKHDIAWQGLRSYFDIEKRQGQVEKKMGKITTKTNDMLETRRSTDGGMASNTASMASSMEQLVCTSNQLLEALGHQKAVVAQAVTKMQAVQESLAALPHPSLTAPADPVQQVKLEQATSALAQAIEALKALECRQ
ncbi:hypothetical protein DUNSADRAFT_11123 [Dunaliella salina]|uniref:Uncharacterized protein n=1 Tax=Dunaliella salina TaxID=3046 RepID=A0ABQ7H4L9_DUNSA|nr:hypothetical protein DUNSADRAFT_11123 [Dunaliella salina]|eukprot:KAF5841807.1 hypothetical protein DUNSADRAFT_11123 [Dunaliella salina]